MEAWEQAGRGAVPTKKSSPRKSKTPMRSSILPLMALSTWRMINLILACERRGRQQRQERQDAPSAPQLPHSHPAPWGTRTHAPAGGRAGERAGTHAWGTTHTHAGAEASLVAYRQDFGGPIFFNFAVASCNLAKNITRKDGAVAAGKTYARVGGCVSPRALLTNGLCCSAMHAQRPLLQGSDASMGACLASCARLRVCAPGHARGGTSGAAWSARRGTHVGGGKPARGTFAC